MEVVRPRRGLDGGEDSVRLGRRQLDDSRDVHDSTPHGDAQQIYKQDNNNTAVVTRGLMADEQ